MLFFLIQKLKIFNAMLHFGDQIFGLEIVETTIFQFEPGFVLLGPYLYFAGERSICKSTKIKISLIFNAMCYDQVVTILRCEYAESFCRIQSD